MKRMAVRTGLGVLCLAVCSMTSAVALAEASSSAFQTGLTIQKGPAVSSQCLATVTATWDHPGVTDVAFSIGSYPWSGPAPSPFATEAVSGKSGSASAQFTLGGSATSNSFVAFATFYGTKNSSKDSTEVLGSATSAPFAADCTFQTGPAAGG
jgi:hypothetical protein